MAIVTPGLFHRCWLGPRSDPGPLAFGSPRGDSAVAAGESSGDKDPLDWLDLLRTLAEILFEVPAANSSPANSSGRPPKWDEQRRRRFEADVRWVREHLKKILRERGEPESITHKDIALYLKLTLPQFYDVDLETLRKYVASGPPKGGAVK